MLFEFLEMELCFEAVPPVSDFANYWRGRLGAALYRSHPQEYARIFKPQRDKPSQTGEGPSGFRDSVRPFVLRAASDSSVTVHLFDLQNDAASVIAQALGPRDCRLRRVAVDLDHRPAELSHMEIHFVTPTDLRSDIPEFATVFARARDRVSALSAAYGHGPLAIDFREMGQRAKQVVISEYELRWHSLERRSGGNGQRYAFRGFTGRAKCSGSLEEFYPILSAAQATGIGRKTVWGHGEIRLAEEAF